MKKEIPILFSTAMVQAILAGRKTMTRRIMKPQPIIDEESGSVFDGKHKRQYDIHNWKDSFIDDFSRWMPEDVLYVRESFYCYGKWVKNGTSKSTGKQKWKFVPDASFENFRYIEDEPFKVQKNSDRVTGWYKRPGLFMPKVFVRIFLEVTDIKVERIHDITEEDSVSEGVEPNCVDASKCPSSTCAIHGCMAKGEYVHYLRDGDDFPAFSAQESFKSLWFKINGEQSWNSNPWVWVISFKVLSTTGKQSSI